MQNTWNKNFIIFLALVIGGLLYVLAPILTPFLVGAILAYLTNPIVDKMVQWRIQRLYAVIIVFFILFLIVGTVIFLLLPLIQDQIQALIDFIPKVIAWVQDKIAQKQINVDVLKATLTENLSKASSAASWLLKTMLHSGMAIVEWTTNFILIPVVTFYLLRDWKIVLKNLHDLLPRHLEKNIMAIILECDEVLSAFFRGQLLVMLSLAIIYSIGLSVVGLQLGLLIGIVAGLVSIVPYLGFIVGIVSASIAAYLQFGTFSGVGLVWVVFAIGQSLESMVLTPRLVGHRIGLHPVAVIFAVLAGGSLFGFFGVLLALPVAAVIMVALRFLNQSYRHSRLYKE